MSGPRRCMNEQADGARHLPPLDGSVWCFSCDPSKAGERKARAAIAGKASHARRSDPAIVEWGDSIRWQRPEDVRETMREAVCLIAKGALSTAQGQTIRQLADSWIKAYALDHPRGKAPEEAPPTVVIPDYRTPRDDVGASETRENA